MSPIVFINSCTELSQRLSQEIRLYFLRALMNEPFCTFISQSGTVRAFLAREPSRWITARLNFWIQVGLCSKIQKLKQIPFLKNIFLTAPIIENSKNLKPSFSSQFTQFSKHS